MSELASLLAGRTHTPTITPLWKPQLYIPTVAQDRERIERVLERPDVTVFDTLVDQLGELAEARSVGTKLDVRARQAAIAAFLGTSTAEDYGVWVYYPWSQRLVHTLPRAQFDELRLSRNRNKISDAEQRQLRQLDICIIGLSVGRASAITLAQEGVCGRLRLADFDRLELSNLNRLRDGVHNLGINKAILTAREIAEIDPFLEVDVFADGATLENLSALLQGGGTTDLVIEECDDLEMKIRIREAARSLKIPVIMETSDRGMIDVERFDLDSDRPVFHGLVGSLRADEVASLATYEKIPYVLAILGVNDISDRLAASLIDIDSTLKTWPQIASAVALGAAINTECVRQIALGQFTASGRGYIDFAEQLRLRDPKANTAQAAPAAAVAAVDFLPPPASSEPLENQVRWLVRMASLAPSGGNCQPWQFLCKGRVIRGFRDVNQSQTLLDFRGCASLLACGAAATNLHLAAASIGWRFQPIWTTDNWHDDLLWQGELVDGDGHPRPDLWQAIQGRCTNRLVTARTPLTVDVADSLHRVVQNGGHRLYLCEQTDALDELADILADADRFRLLHPRLHRELFAEIRWTADEAKRTGSGIDIASLELDPTQRAAMQLAQRASVMATLEQLEGGQGLGRGTRKAIRQSSAMALLVAPNNAMPQDWLQGGWVTQHLWLEAQRVGLAVQPMAALLYLLERAKHDEGSFDAAQRQQLMSWGDRLARAFGVSHGHPMMLLRLFRSPEPRIRAARRPLDTILTLEDD